MAYLGLGAASEGLMGEESCPVILVGLTIPMQSTPWSLGHGISKEKWQQ